MNDTYTAKELALALGVTVMTVHRRAEAESWPVAGKRPGRGGGKLYALAALPLEVREAVARQAAGAAAAGRGVGRELGRATLAEDLADAEARAQGLSRFQQLPPTARVRAEARAALVQACREYTLAAGLSPSAGRRRFATAYNAGRIEVEASVRAALDTVSAGSLRNWDRALDTQGLERLAGKQGRHRAGTGSIDGCPALRDFVLGMLTEYPHATAKQVLRGIEARFAADKQPSQRAVQRWVKAWKAAHAQLHCAVANPDKWRSRYQAAAGDAGEAVIRLNQVWEYDSTPGDVLLADGVRHAVLGVIDIYTRRLKLHVARTSSAAGICSLTRRALMDWGVPEAAKTDNGADYVSKQMQRVFLGLGVEHVRAPHFSPERKPFIERAFRTFSHDLVELLAGYSGHSVAQRKDIEARRSYAERLMQTGETVDLSRLGVEQFQKFCDQWCECVYHHDAHGGLGGKTPWQLAAEWPHPVVRLRPEDERALDVLLLPAPTNDGWRTVGKKGLPIGTVHYNSPKLGGLEGQRVQALLDEADAGVAYVFDEDGKFIDRAVAPEIVGVSRAEIAAQRKARQKKVIDAQKAELQRIARETGVRDIVREILEHRAQEAGRLARLPQASVPHSTPALEEAARAARVQDAPPLNSEANAAARQQLLEGPKVHQLQETPRQRWNRWVAVDSALGLGAPVGDADREYHRTYRMTAEWASWRDLMGWAPVEPAAQAAQ